MTFFIGELKKQVDEADWPIVVAALRNNAFLWEKLQDQAFAENNLQRAGSNRKHWSPAYIALASSGFESEFQNLNSHPILAADEKLRFPAASFFENASEGDGQADEATFTLEQSLFLAIAVRENFRLKGNWEGLFSDMSFAPAKAWRLAISCLFGILPDPSSLLSHLFDPESSLDQQELALHALLTNPLNEDEQYQMLQDSAKAFSFKQWLDMLKAVSRKRPSLAMRLASHALATLPENREAEGDFDQLERILIESEMRQLGGEHEIALSLLTQAWDSTQRLQAELANKLARSAEKTDNFVIANAALEQAALLDPGDSKLRARIVSQKIREGKLQAKDINARERNQPEALIAAAKIAMKGNDRTEAQMMLQSAWTAIKNKKHSSGIENLNNILDLVIENMLLLDMASMAKEAALFAGKKFPESGKAAFQLCLALIACDEKSAGLDAAHLAVALEPQDAKFRRQLAIVLQEAGAIEAAYEEWDHLVNAMGEGNWEDLYGFAISAFESDDLQKSEDATRQLVEEKSESAEAHLLLGRIFQATNHGDAVKELEIALSLDPSIEAAWLTLSQVFMEKEDVDSAIEALKKAERMLHNSAAIKANLGFLFAEAKMAEEGISILRKAQTLIKLPHNNELGQKVYLALGKLELEVGEDRHALQSFEQAQLLFPGNHEIAQALGQSLMKAGEPESALNAFVAARQGNPDDLDLLLETASAHVASGVQVQIAIDMLEKAISSKPDLLEAEILLGEAEIALEHSQMALKRFSRLFKSSKGLEQGIIKRIALGKAGAEKQMGERGKGLETLESLQKSHPKDLDVLRALCDSYCEAQRHEEAFQIANQLYLSSEQNEETILWYARQAENSGKGKEAIRALSKALGNNIESSAIWQRLAELEWVLGSRSAARKLFNEFLTKKEFKSEDLIEAANFLRTKKSNKLAIRFVKRAIEKADQAESGYFQTLSACYFEENLGKAAIEAIDKAISITPQNPSYLIKKSEIYQAMERPQAALESIDQALALLPRDVQLLETKSLMLQENGDFNSALASAEKAVEASKGSFKILKLAANLAVDTLQQARARSLLAPFIKASKDVDLIGLDAGIALEIGEYKEAAKILGSLPENHKSDPQLLSLQAQLYIRQGDLLKGGQAYKKSLKEFGSVNKAGQLPDQQSNSLYAIANAAEALKDWDTSRRIFTQLVERHPKSARFQFGLGKMIVNQAEWQQKSVECQIIQHAPGEKSTSSAKFKDAVAAFKIAKTLAPREETKAAIAHWEIRAHLRFAPGNFVTEIPNSYPASSAEAASLLYAQSQNKEVKSRKGMAEPYANSIDVVMQKAFEMQDKEAAKAFVLAKQAVELAPHEAALHALEGRLAIAIGKDAAAKNSYAHALELWPKEAHWHAALAQLQIKDGDHVSARAHLEKAVRFEGEFAGHHQELGQVYLESQKLEAAIQSFAKAKRLEPNNAQHLISLATAQLEKGDLLKADQNAKRGSKLDKNSLDSLLVRARVANGQSKTAKALELIAEAEALKSDEPKVYGTWAEILYSAGKIENAIAKLDKAAQAAEDPLAWQIKKAEMIAELKGEDFGNKRLALLHERYPKRPEIFAALSRAQAKTGNLKRASSSAQQAIKHAKQLPLIEQARLFLHAAVVNKNLGQLDQALHELDQAGQLADHLIDIHLERGQIHLARRQQKAALEAFELAAQISPENPEPHLLRAKALKNAKDYKGSEIALRKAVQISPKDLNIQRQLAAIIALNFVHHSELTGVES